LDNLFIFINKATVWIFNLKVRNHKNAIATDDSIIIAAVKMFLKLVKAVWNELSLNNRKRLISNS
jgi:hypothetical protein